MGMVSEKLMEEIARINAAYGAVPGDDTPEIGYFVILEYQEMSVTSIEWYSREVIVRATCDGEVRCLEEMLGRVIEGQPGYRRPGVLIFETNGVPVVL